MAQLSFNAATVAPQASFTPIPAGVYTTTVIDSEVKITQKGGEMAVFTLQVVDGQFAGRKLFARINVRNQSADAERIGQSQLSALCHAAGVLQLVDTSQLHGKAVRARVKIRKDDSGQYGDQNEVNGFEALSGAPAVQAVGSVAPSQPAPAQASSVPPWKKAAA